MKLALAFALLASVLLLGCVQYGQQQVPVATPIVVSTPAPTPTPPPTPVSTPQLTPVSTLEPTPTPAQEVRVIEVTGTTNKGTLWEWRPNPIKVKQGERVKLRISVPAGDATHGFSLPDYGINVAIQPGEMKEVEFTADKAGFSNFLCSIPCGAGHPNMRGSLIVE